MIIPYKDEAKYIKDCVSTIPESAEIEILLVADGGKEAVPQWVFEDQRISVILPEEGKGGVAACRNLGILISARHMMIKRSFLLENQI